MRTLPQTEQTGDYLSNRAQDVRDMLALSEEQREELIADIASEKFREKLAANDPVNLLAALESFSLKDGQMLLNLFMTDGAAFRALIAARMVELIQEDAEFDAADAVEKSESLIRQERLEH
jgi:hypothetical protein